MDASPKVEGKGFLVQEHKNEDGTIKDIEIIADLPSLNKQDDKPLQ